MVKLRKFLAGLLAALANEIYDLSLWIEKAEPVEENLLDLAASGESDYATFKEGMVSKDYRVRHSAANKLVSWYIDGNGHPVIEELTIAASVLLEDFEFTNGDVSTLVDAWIAQASSTSQEELDKAKDQENSLFKKLPNKNISTTK